MPAMQSQEASLDELSALIQRVHAGEEGARDRLFAAAYPDLRELARSRLYHGGRGTDLGTTALVHETFLRFVRGGELRATERRAFFAYAASVMRSVIVDTVRERLAQRRGGELQRTTLDTEFVDLMPSGEDEVMQVHEALQALAEAEPRLAQVVEMRYFGGWTEAEIGDALGITERTVRRDWEKARLLLSTLMRD
ncbi:MAG: sigma-70 family RNA polymerase sigma factor [Rubrivivax sp.]|nr:sigma-70 family RNA polymerase sigma factor [Rubrivivax sp.]